MVQVATLHIKVEPEMAKGMKMLARKKGKTMGELVRQAITVCYQPEFSGLSLCQRQTLDAYLGNYVSLGKLSQVMGLSPQAMLGWLRDHAIEPQTGWHTEDAAHA